MKEGSLRCGEFDILAATRISAKIAVVGSIPG